MTEEQFINYWYIGLAIAAVIVVIVAALALTLIIIARNILRNAQGALKLANEIVANTKPVWDLETTNQVAVQLLDGARAIRTHATQIADALEAIPAQPSAKE